MKMLREYIIQTTSGTVHDLKKKMGYISLLSNFDADMYRKFLKTPD